MCSAPFRAPETKAPGAARHGRPFPAGAGSHDHFVHVRRVSADPYRPARRRHHRATLALLVVYGTKIEPIEKVLKTSTGRR